MVYRSLDKDDLDDRNRHRVPLCSLLFRRIHELIAHCAGAIFNYASRTMVQRHRYRLFERSQLVDRTLSQHHLQSTLWIFGQRVRQDDNHDSSDAELSHNGDPWQHYHLCQSSEHLEWDLLEQLDHSIDRGRQLCLS